MIENLTESRLPQPVARVWRGYVEEWDRSLRAANKPCTTRYNYELAVCQLAEFLGGEELPAFLRAAGRGEDEIGDDSDAAEDPTDVERRHVEWFLVWMIETRSASTALNKYKGLQQFFNYLVDEEEMPRHPMDRIPQPSVTQKLVPVLPDEDIAALLATCSGEDVSGPAGHSHHSIADGLGRPAHRDRLDEHRRCAPQPERQDPPPRAAGTLLAGS